MKNLLDGTMNRLLGLRILPVNLTYNIKSQSGILLRLFKLLIYEGVMD